MRETDLVYLASKIAEGLKSNYQSRRQAELIGHLIAIQKQQLRVLEDTSQAVMLLLKADFEAAVQHLTYSRLAERTQDRINVDLAKARDLLVRALSQTEDIYAKAAMRLDVATCSALLGDYTVAQYEAQKARDSVDGVVDQIEHRLHWWTRYADTCSSLLEKSPWWGIPGKIDTRRQLEECNEAVAKNGQDLLFWRPLQESIQLLQAAFNKRQ